MKKAQVKKSLSFIQIPEIAKSLPLSIFPLSDIKIKQLHSHGFVKCGSLNGIFKERLLREIDSLGLATLEPILRQLLEMESYKENACKFTLLLDEALNTLNPEYTELPVTLFESKEEYKLQSQTGAARNFGKYRQWADERLKSALKMLRCNVDGAVLLLFYNWSKKLKQEFSPLRQSFLKNAGFVKGKYSFGFYMRLIGKLQSEILHLDEEHKVKSLTPKEKQFQNDIIEILTKKGAREENREIESKGNAKGKARELVTLPIKLVFEYLRSGINNENDWSKLSEQRFCEFLPKLDKFSFQSELNLQTPLFIFIKELS